MFSNEAMATRKGEGRSAVSVELHSEWHEKIFESEEDAFAFIEAQVWPRGPVCPHCGTTGRSRRLRGESTRVGTYKCYQCRKPFTAKIGTFLEGSHLPLALWLQAIYLICALRMSPDDDDLHIALDLPKKTVKSMAERLHVAMASAPNGGDGPQS